MSRSRREYGGYRGRRTVTDILRWIAITLAVVVVLVLAGLWFGQKYLVYTDDGLRLELPPFLQSLRGDPTHSGSRPDPDEIHYTEQPGSSSAPSSDAGEEEPPAPQAAPVALELGLDAVLSGSAAQQLEQAGAQVLVLEMKADSGKLGWPSGQAAAVRAQVNGTQAAADALRQWNAGEVYTVARVCCFRDDSVPYFHNAMALRRAGYNWRDERGLRWLSPANRDAQAYVAALCGELAGLGFDEIVLEDFAFPTQGNLETINRGDSYDPAQFTAQVEAFLTQVSQALEPYGTKLSLRVGRDTLAGQDSASGVTAQVLERFAARVWTEDDGLSPDPAALVEQAGLTGGTDRLVEITAVPAPDWPTAQAVLLP